MAQISIIQYKNVIEAKRFDAEYFKPEYLESIIIIKKHDFFLNSQVSEIKSGTTPKDRENGLKKGVVLLKTGNIRNNILLYDKTKFFHVSSEINKRMKSTELKNKDVLLNIVGATTNVIGRTAIIMEDFPKANITQAMVFCRVKSKDILPEYLFTFFQTKFGLNQTKRLARPTGQYNLNLQEVGKFLIPRLNKYFQHEIEKIVKDAHQKQKQSKQLYKEAEELLLKELELTNYKPEQKLTFETTKKEVEKAKRFDSEYYQPKYKRIIEKIENYKGGFDDVKNILNWKKGVEVGSDAYTEKGKDFIRVSDFSIFGIEDTSKRITNELFEEIKDEFQPKKGEIIFTKDGTIGISYVLKENIEGILSGAFLRLTLKENYKNFEKECLSLIFNSIVCKMQVKKLSGGALIAHLKPSDFEKFKIPLIKPEIQKRIADKIQRSHKLRKESKELLELAKRKVEEEIEKS